MITISCYKLSQNQLTKAFCRLAEKCYYSGLKSTVLTASEEYSQLLDRMLWTYSKQHFIPHATCTDPMSEKQPVYITHDTKSLKTYSEIIIFVNATSESLLQDISNIQKKSIENIQKILFIFDQEQDLQFQGVQSIIEKSNIKNFTIRSFVQNNKAGWTQEN